MAANRRRSVQDLEKLRVSLHHYFFDVIPLLTTDFQRYADELDVAYKDIKIAKVSGQAGCVAGGVLAFVGFGLSFVTFGASLGLCIAGGVIAGAGGATAGGASTADLVKARKARTITQKQLEQSEQDFRLVLAEGNDISEQLEYFCPIDIAFPDWKQFWAKIVLGSGRVAANVGWKIVANTVHTAIRLGKGIDVASASVPLFRTLGAAAARGAQIAGGVASVVFLPIDVFLLVSNSVELHKNRAHKDSKKIREIIKEIRNKCPTEKEIDEMIDNSISVLLH